MNSLVKSSALAIMLSLATVTTAGATQPDSSTSVKPAEAQSLVAQARPPQPRSRLDATRTRPYVDEMIMMHMQMVDAAQKAMQSPDPEVRRMAEETMKYSNTQIDTLMEMRRKFFENPDKG